MADYSLYGRIGNLERWARTTPEQRRTATEPAREAWARRFERQADPDGVMSEKDRAEAGERLMRAYMLRMSKAAAEARARKSKGTAA